MLPRHARHRTPRPGRALAAALLAGALISTGCNHAAGPDTAPSPGEALSTTPDTPATLPAAPALFATVMAPAPPPAQQVERTSLPPRPPDASQVARQALAPARQAAARHGVAAGLVVCDPVCVSPGLEMFGSGCGRWLDLVAAGQPELGRTPLWESRERARHEMGRTDFRLAPAQATTLAAMTGATHAACGTIGGTPAHCTLTYGLYDLRGGSLIGPPLTRAGSEAQVLAALPAVARALDARLGVAAPHVPASVGLSPAEMARVMAISREDGASDADLLALGRLSARSPLAGMYYLDTRAIYDQVLLSGTVRTLLSQLPANALVVAHIGSTNPAALRPYAATTRALIARYPASALLAHADVWVQRMWGTRAGEWQAARRASNDAPSEPDAWLSVGYTLGNIAEDLRQSRLAGDLSPADWSALSRLYPQQEGAFLRATVLDPNDGHAWLRLAEAATFADDGPRAARALTRALALDPDKGEVYAWGLQMYQPKWGGDPAALNHIAARAAAQPWDNSQAATGAAESLLSAGFAAQAAQVLSGFIARESALVARTPSDPTAHWGLAAALAAQDTAPSLRTASLEYRTAEHLMPNAPAIHQWLGDVLDRRHRTAEAIAEYRLAAALDPFASRVHFALGYDLKHERRFPEALSELRLAMRLDPRNADAHFGLGELLAMQNRFKAAVIEYREAIRMSYYSLDAWAGLPAALDECGQYDASLRAGREADRLLTEMNQANSEVEPAIHNTMSDDYLHKKDWGRSIAESHVALGHNPNDACAHENLAEAYLGQGHKAEAHAEWGRAIALGDALITPVARRLLAANP